MANLADQIAVPVSRERLHRWADQARRVYADWDREWTTINESIEDRGLTVLCQPGCVTCCYSRKFCSVSEAAAVIEYLDENFSPEENEQFRMRTELTVGSLARLRDDRCCESADVFASAGGLECPFLREGRCAIYPARPLECRIQVATSEVNRDDCFRCPHAAGIVEAEVKGRQLTGELRKKERDLDVPILPWREPGPLLPETLSYLWNNGASAPNGLLTRQAWTQRLASRNTTHDETWLDDCSDFRAMSQPLSLPDEGDYPPDLTVVNQTMETQKLYDRTISVKGLPALKSLYKRDPGCRFDWNERRFTWDDQSDSEIPYAVWMSDGVQERLMMWEAAKRCRGRVLCGGLGLGIFPQLALSLPRVESVHIIDVDRTVISLIRDTWKRKPWTRMKDCSITASPIEEFLKTTSERYDTVYIDTWDAIYHEYLPHLNELICLSQNVLNPGGEILLWAYDMMVRQFLETATLLANKRDAYCAAEEPQLNQIRQSYPLLYELVAWLREHPTCSEEELLSRAYQVATHHRNSLGILKLTSTDVGGMNLLQSQLLNRDGA